MPIPNRLTPMISVILLAASCTRAAPDASDNSAAAKVTSAGEVADKSNSGANNDAPPAEGACRLLSLSEVRAVFPDAEAGVENNSLRQYGMTACEWAGKGARLAARTEAAAGHSAEDSVRELADGSIDPMNAAARGRVRFEQIPGVGNDAWLVLEQRDEKGGFLANMAILSLRRGDTMVTLMSNDLSGRDRTETKAALRKLGQQVAGRL